MSVFLFLNVLKNDFELQDANQSVLAYPGNTERKDNLGKGHDPGGLYETAV